MFHLKLQPLPTTSGGRKLALKPTTFDLSCGSNIQMVIAMPFKSIIFFFLLICDKFRFYHY